MMKEFGIGLSSGQKQIMALTRVLHSDPEVLVLDEVTAHLDPQSESFIADRIFENKQHRTTVMVVQKISAARKADRIFVVKQGRIIEEGDHNRLLSLGGEYSELYRHQVSEDS
ncbi:MAG: ABC transporter ATP-binding protein [Proteobacteria bacterium]|nr:MAG: ABC transporter ATP-binding protein [Pseudomonadota bacterium]